ncbi:hypothetical protein ACFQ6V_29575 [Streptomyces roseifaciens]
MCAWALSTRSKLDFWRGQLHEAIARTQRAANFRPAGTVGVLLQCQEADAWSQLGARTEARNAMKNARDAAMR